MSQKIRYAVLGLGDIAQEAVLPAFAETKSSQLVALISGDPEKLQELGKKYKIERTHPYQELERCLSEGGIDAVYVATPNHLHREHTERSLRAGAHVLCEKPMAPTEADCQAMIASARQHDRKLMIAYRLHFEPSTLKAIEIAQTELGNLRIFSSVFSQQLKPGNVRAAVSEDLGGGAMWDMGVYCINAARYFFRDEPFEAIAASANGDHSRFQQIDEMTSAILRFPGDRLATVTSSFGASSTDRLTLVGTKGRLEIEPAYGFTDKLIHRLTVDGKTSETKYPQTQHFSGEIDYFSECIQNGDEPEPNGEEGLADVRIIDAMYRSAMSGGAAVRLAPFHRTQRPTEDQAKKRSPHYETDTVNASSPGEES